MLLDDDEDECVRFRGTVKLLLGTGVEIIEDVEEENECCLNDDTDVLFVRGFDESDFIFASALPLLINADPFGETLFFVNLLLGFDFLCVSGDDGDDDDDEVLDKFNDGVLQFL